MNKQTWLILIAMAIGAVILTLKRVLKYALIALAFCAASYGLWRLGDWIIGMSCKGGLCG
jgi:hypothetical protein